MLEGEQKSQIEKGRQLIKGYIIKQIFIVGNQSLILMGNFGRQIRINILKLCFLMVKGVVVFVYQFLFLVGWECFWGTLIFQYFLFVIVSEKYEF